MTLLIKEAIILVKAHLDGVVGSGRYALGFVVDLAMMMTQRQRNMFRLVEEVAILEGKSRRTSSTKPESQFKREPLLGYWHKHYTDASHMPQNILNEMRRDQTVPRILAQHVGKTLTDSIFSELTKALLQDNFLRRKHEGRLTGEWIIFGRADSHNYYLTLAEHREADIDTAERIHRYEAIDQQIAWDSRRGHGIGFLQPD